MPRHPSTHAAASSAKLPPLPLPLPPTTDLLRKNAALPSSSPPTPLPSSTPSRTRRISAKSAPTPAPLPSKPKGPVGQNKPTLRRVRRQWSAEEDALVLRGLQLHGNSTNKWILIAGMVPGRTRLQVKSRARRLMPDVYGDKRHRRPSAALSASRSGSESGSDEEEQDPATEDGSSDGTAVNAGLAGADAQEQEAGSRFNVDEQTIMSPSALSAFARAHAGRSPSSSPPPPPLPEKRPEKRPRRISTSRKASAVKSPLPPLPTSPPILSPTLRPPVATLPPLPTFLPPLSPPPLPLPTPRRPSTFSKRSRRSTTPTSPHSSLSSAPPSPDAHSPPTKHAKPNLLDPFTLLEPLTPPAPPYTLHISPLALALMDMHAHLLQTEVIGLFGGTFDAASRTLRISTIFPCDSPTHSSSIQCEMDPVAETHARDVFAGRGLGVVGWYHSHPTFDAWPSVRDVENQGVYQRLFATAGEAEGEAEAGQVEPFVGAIVTPYHAHRATVVSEVAFYCVGGEGYEVPYRVDEVRDEADGGTGVQVLDVFDGFCEHHLKELQHLAGEYRGWRRYTKMKHSVRVQSGLDLDAPVDQFVAKVLGPELLVDGGHVAPNDEDEGDVDV